MNDEELRLAKNIGEQMSGKILCPRECVEGQELSVFGDFEDSLFCPHCEMEVTLTVKYRDGDKPKELLCACKTFALEASRRAYLDGSNFVHTTMWCSETPVDRIDQC